MKYLKYFLLLFFILIFTPNGYAYTYDVTNSITAPSGSGSTGGHYLGLEIYNSGSQNNYTVNTRYNGTLSDIVYNLPLPSDAGQCFTTNMDYTITMEMATDDWRNHFSTPFIGAYSSATNWSSSGVTFVSLKKIYFKFKIPSSETSCVDFVYVNLHSPNVSSTAFTGTTNWKLSKVTLTDLYSSSGGSSGSGGSGGGSGSSTPTPDPNQNIINNANQNTNNIIENNNNNTQDIIDNQNSLLTNKCSNLLDVSNIYQNNVSNYNLIDNGIQLIANSSWQNVRYRIPVENGEKYYFSGLYTTQNANSIFLSLSYDNNDIVGSRFYNCEPSSELTGSCQTNFISDRDGYVYLGIWVTKANTSNNASYLKMMFSTETPNYCPFGSNTTNKIDDVTNSINNTNDYLQDDSDPVIDDDEFTSLFDSVAINNPLSSLLQLPVQFINAIVNQSNTCQVVNLGTLLGVPITLPCIDIGSIIGSTVWNTIDILSSIGLIVLILKQMYESITNALTLGGYMEAKKGGLGYMPPLEFLCSILTIGERDI